MRDMCDGAVVVQKISCLAFARAMAEAWRTKQVFIPLDASTKGPLFDLLGEVKVDALPDGGGWFDEALVLDDEPAPAQISFSSGTTGLPKPILVSRRAVSDTCNRLIEVMGLDASAREYVGVPITFSFGMGRVRAIAAAGGQSYLPDSGFRLDEFSRLLKAEEVNSLSAVPTLLRLLIQQRDSLRDSARNLRWLEIGSQTMSAEEKAAIREIFPNARIVQHYGLTEASRTTFLRIDGASVAELESVGRATGRVEVTIGDDSRIYIRGPHLADGVLTEHGVVPVALPDGWLRTSDIGELRDGTLYFIGRADDMVNVSGIKVPADLFEQRLIARLGTASGHVAVAACPDPLRGQALLVAHLANLDPEAVRASADLTGSEFGLSPADINICEVHDFPCTETGKLQRNKIAESYVRAMAEDYQAEGSRELRASFQRALNRRNISDADSFSSLAGDSLAYVEVSMAIERLLGHLPPDWERISVGEIERLARETEAASDRNFRWVATEMLIRPLAIFLVVTTHALSSDVGKMLQGGALTLLMVAGYNSARFQRDRMIASNRWVLLWQFFFRLILPFYIILGVYEVFTKNRIGWRSLVLISNYWRDPGVVSMTQFWFIPVLFQCLLLTIILFSIAPIRAFAARYPWRFALSMVAGAAGLKMLAPVLIGNFFSAPTEFHAHHWAYAFALGWLVNEADTNGKKLFCVAGAYLLAGLDFGFTNFHSILLLCAVWVILFVPRLKLWAPLAEVAAFLAQATFYIYLVQGIAIHLIRERLHIMSVPLMIVTAVSAGVVAFLGWQALLRRSTPLASRMINRIHRRRDRKLPT